MSRNFTSDQQLTDRLYFSDATAFEELYHRYWFSLYNYSFKKLQSSEDAKKVVRDIFVELWKKRELWPLDFSVSQFFYSEVRKAVISMINQKLIDDNKIAEELILDFSTQGLLQAKLPVRNQVHSTITNGRQSINNKEKKFSSIFNIKWLRHGIVAKLN